jgi:hypothetical protein
VAKMDYDTVMLLVFLLAYSCIPIVLILGFVGISGILEVNVEYINGILTASGIIFGFWTIMLGKEPKNFVEKWLYKNVILRAFWFVFGFFLFSIICVYFSALNKMPSSIALLFVTLSLLYNALFLILLLHSSIRRTSERFSEDRFFKHAQLRLTVNDLANKLSKRQ